MKRAAFIPGQTYIPASGKVYDEEEVENAIAAARDCWWTEGRFAKEFEEDFGKYLRVKYVSLTNSGSSANLLAVASLTSTVFGKKRLKPGDEFITTPVAFPTTVNPAILYGLKPVFIDIDLKTLNIDSDKIEHAITKKTKLIILAHTLGIPFNLERIMKIVKKYDLWLIEDCCDALGSKYGGRLCGTFGDIASFSFYPAHQMSCSKETPIPYLDEHGKWKLEKVGNIYKKYKNYPNKIKILSFDKNLKATWANPSTILRHKLGNKKVVKITCQHGRNVEVTEDHSVFILDKNTAKITPKSAINLDKDDYIVTTNNIPIINEVKFIDIIDHFRNKNAYVSNFSYKNLKYVKNHDYRWQFKDRNSLPIKYLKHYDLDRDNLTVGIFQSNKIPARILINEQLCRLIGYFIAEGSYQNGLVLSFNIKENDLIKDVKSISESLFRNIPLAVRKTKHNAVNIELESKNLEILFKEIFGIRKYASKKRIPWFLYHTSKNCIYAFIYGYTRGDGTLRKLPDNTNRIDVTSVSKELLNDFQYLLSIVGISASFYRRNKAGKRKIGRYEITSNGNYSLCFSGYIYKNNSIIKMNTHEKNNLSLQIPLLPIFRKYITLGKKQQLISRIRLKKHLRSNKDLYSLVSSDLCFLKVRSIQEIPYNQDEHVYDFSVPGKENFYGGFLGLFLHNTMGEGGAIITNNPLIHRAIRQFRDWGRDCWCDTGRDNTCGKRFSWKLGDLPKGYDHKYIYSQIGYNLKLTDFQAAIGLAQLKKLPYFIKKRKENYRKLYEFFKKYTMKNSKLKTQSSLAWPPGQAKPQLKAQNFIRNSSCEHGKIFADRIFAQQEEIIGRKKRSELAAINHYSNSNSGNYKNYGTKKLNNHDLVGSKYRLSRTADQKNFLSEQYFLLPVTSSKEDPCWFGFPVIVHPDAPFTRNELTEYLEQHKIGTRTVFAGNLLRHPAYKNVKYKVVGSLKNADLILNNAFWIGVYPGIDQKRINYIKSIINAYFQSFLTHSSK